ncbi:hypothetical protein M5689_020519 [Euphorbia peplus]|nr:hypothetical protein M5689_020519 [Euphorbia peplus]
MGPRLLPKKERTHAPIEEIKLNVDTQKFDELLNRLTTSTDKEDKARYKEVKNLPFISTKINDWNSLQKLGLDDEVCTLLNGAGDGVY